MTKRKINVAEHANEIMECVRKGAFLTTKCGDKVNSMVIGWGQIGITWNLTVFITYVRDSRYTYELLEANPEFTINVPINGFDKEAYAICGSKSGRDMDKIKEAGLTTVEPEEISVPGIKEYPLTLECRVIYKDLMEPAKLREDLREKFYTGDPSEHTAYYGEIVAAYIIE